VQQTSDGGYIVAGSFDSTNGDMTGLNKGYSDAVITKFDSMGNTVWFKSYGGSANDYLSDAQQTFDGGYIVVGASSSIDVDMSGLNKGGSDGIIAKLDSNGNKVWIKAYGGGDSDSFYSVQQSSDGGYVVAGGSYSIDENMAGLAKSNTDYTDAIVTKVDNNGDIVWFKSYGGIDSDSFNSIRKTSDGGYIAVGYSYSNDDDMAMLNKGDSDAIIAKLDSTGNIVWIKSYGGSATDSFYSAQQTADGGYIAIGESYSTDGNMAGLAKGDIDTIIIKLDSNGNTSWVKSYGGSDTDSFYSVQQTVDGGYIFGGGVYSTDNDMTGLNKGDSDSILIKIDSTGKLIN